MNSQIIVSGVPSRHERKEGTPDRRLGHNNLGCWIKNLLLHVLMCSIAEKFYSLLVF